MGRKYISEESGPSGHAQWLPRSRSGRVVLTVGFVLLVAVAAGAVFAVFLRDELLMVSVRGATEDDLYPIQLSFYCIEGELFADVSDYTGRWLAEQADGWTSVQLAFVSERPPTRPRPMTLVMSGYVFLPSSVGTHMKLGYGEPHFPPRREGESTESLLRRARATSDRGEAETVLEAAVHHEILGMRVEGEPLDVAFDLADVRGELVSFKAKCEGQR